MEVVGSEFVTFQLAIPGTQQPTAWLEERCMVQRALNALPGDCNKWLVATTDAVIGETYENQDRPILASSDSASRYSALWYNRA
eukprot:scaffold33493_cov172-Skeletonema_dohrnii-CCMP3373.AAC.1